MRPGIELANKRVLVVGLARTGLATALFCAAHGARVTATEQRSATQLGETLGPLRAAGCALELGGHSAATFLEQDLIVPSPGVPATHPGLAAARAAHIPIWSEIELAWRFLRGRLIAITGSNGKTTVTSLVGHILSAARNAPHRRRQYRNSADCPRRRIHCRRHYGSGGEQLPARSHR